MNRHVMRVLLLVYLTAGGVVLPAQALDVQQLVADAEKGDIHAQYELGIQYRLGTHIEKNYALALNWLTKAARQGHLEAQNRVAICYNNGEGTLPDKIKAYAWYLVASMNGHKLARAKQKVYTSVLNKRQLYEGQKLAKEIYQGINETEQRASDSQ